MVEREFDELKQTYEHEKVNINSYFSEMDLTDKEKEKRKEFANEMKDVLLFIFTLYLLMKQYDYINKQYIIQQLQEKYSNTILKYMQIDDYINGMVIDSVKDIVETTFNHDGEEFYTSEDRAELIACNSANDTLNYKQYADAVKAGKKHKKWITERDRRVRRTHKELDSKVIPIGDTFLVGNILMRFPHDTLFGISYKELANCRCTIKYF